MKHHSGTAQACVFLFTFLLVMTATPAHAAYPDTAFSAESILLKAQPAVQAQSTPVKAVKRPVHNSVQAQNRQVEDFNDTLHGIALSSVQQQSRAQQYYLHLNKSSRVLTIYYADAQGYPTDRIQNAVFVAIGKRTTPTPSGTFVLGTRERWNDFGRSSAPHATEYTDGRYLHGPLYAQKNEATLLHEKLNDFGETVTGGCLRMPYDTAMWIYENCGAGTVLRIVNGDS